jgi:hypothetical protein
MPRALEDETPSGSTALCRRGSGKERDSFAFALARLSGPSWRAVDRVHDHSGPVAALVLAVTCKRIARTGSVVGTSPGTPIIAELFYAPEMLKRLECRQSWGRLALRAWAASAHRPAASALDVSVATSASMERYDRREIERYRERRDAAEVRPPRGAKRGNKTTKWSPSLGEDTRELSAHAPPRATNQIHRWLLPFRSSPRVLGRWSASHRAPALRAPRHLFTT